MTHRKRVFTLHPAAGDILASSLLRVAKYPLRGMRDAARALRSEVRQFGASKKMKGLDKLQLGAGPKVIPGWCNIDLESAEVCWDLTRPLPIAYGTIRYIYSEHFIEHITREQARMVLANCFDVLAHRGKLRLSTPDLRVLIDDYRDGRLVEMPHGNWFPSTPCQMVNEAMRSWGHQFVYDEAELTLLLQESGFSNIERKDWQASADEELRNLETRPYYGDLILEAQKL